MNNSITQVLQPVMQQLLDSAKAQYETQLDTLQREYARHVTTIKQAFGNNDKRPDNDHQS